jgi:hypothetical protein
MAGRLRRRGDLLARVTHLARSGALDSQPRIFRLHPTIDGSPASLPGPMPFGSALVGLMDQPVDRFFGGPDDNPDAVISEHQGVLPSMYQHDRSFHSRS